MWTTQEIELLKDAYRCQREGKRIFPLELINKHTRVRCMRMASELGISSIASQPSFINIISSNDLNYIAGFLDADGSISFNPRPILRIANSNMTILNWFKTTIGTGKIVQKQHIEQYTKKHYSYFLARTNDIYPLLSQLKPYIKGKNEKIEKALSWLETRYPHLRPP